MYVDTHQAFSSGKYWFLVALPDFINCRIQLKFQLNRNNKKILYEPSLAGAKSLKHDKQLRLDFLPARVSIFWLSVINRWVKTDLKIIHWLICYYIARKIYVCTHYKVYSRETCFWFNNAIKTLFKKWFIWQRECLCVQVHCTFRASAQERKKNSRSAYSTSLLIGFCTSLHIQFICNTFRLTDLKL